MIRGRSNWSGATAYQTVIASGWEGIARTVVFYHSQVVLALNVSADPYQRTRTRDTSRGRKGSKYTAYRNPSKLGEVPHKRKGHLQGGVKMELDKARMRGRVGVVPNVKYGLILELNGRSFMLSTLKRVFAQLQALAGGGGGNP